MTEILHSDAGIGIGIVHDDGKTVVGNGECPRQILAVLQVLSFLGGEVTRGERQPGLQIHQLLHSLLLVDILGGDAVERLVLEIIERFVDNGVETLVGSQTAGGFLIGLLHFRIRLAPTCVEQA